MYGIGYLTSAWQFLASLLKTLKIIDFQYDNPNTKNINQYDSLTVKWRYICCAVMTVLIIPINYQRSLGTLRYFSMLIFITIIYTIIVAVVQLPEYYHAYSDDPRYHVDWVVADFNINWFQGFATFMLSFNCQVLFFYVRGEMMLKSNTRVMKVIKLLTSSSILVFLAMNIAAYLSLGKNLLPTLYTLRRKVTEDSGDYTMLIAQILFTIAAFFKIALLLFPAREQVYIYYKFSRAAPTHLLITCIFSIIVFAVPCFYPDIKNMLGLLGGVTVGTVGYSVPLVLKLAHLRKIKNYGPAFIYYSILLAVVVTIQVLSTYISISSSIKGKK